MKRQKPWTHRIRPDENDLSKSWRVRCIPGKSTIRLTRTAVDVLSSKSRSTVACMNAVCAGRYLDQFPKGTRLVVFERSRAYAIYRIRDGIPTWAAVWIHNDTKGIDSFDELGPKATVELGKAEKEIVLSPPPAQRIGRPNSTPGIQHSHVNTGKNSSHRIILPRGAKARAEAAGLLLPL